jgi:Plasmid pRiA4b ORF-3-like protein
MRAKTRKPRDGPVPADLTLQYLIVLAGTDPLVWRRIRVPATYTFWDLHVAIQDAMGWFDCHLHHFRVVDPESGISLMLGIPDPDLEEDRSVTADWTEFPIDFTNSSQPIQYTYDFGDNWSHVVVFEGFENGEPNTAEPVFVAGAGACPPEDSGGPHHYGHIVAVLADPNHPEHAELMEWAGEPIDPTAFAASDVHFDDPSERWEKAFE